MRKKIFNAIWVTSVTLFFLSLMLSMIMLYSYFSDVRKKELIRETELIARGTELSGTEFLSGLNTDDCRITLITGEGEVFYDSATDSRDMENHFDREEIRDALLNGSGFSERYSETLSEKMLYSAKLLNDGSVLRVAVTEKSVWALFLHYAWPICLMASIIVIFSFFLASRLSEKLLSPINTINPDRPCDYMEDPSYREIVPLLKRMEAQQSELKSDQEKLSQLADMRREFTANVSHELKGPLHAIMGYAELMENGLAKEEDITLFAGRIGKESRRLSNLVDDIIDLTRLDEGAENYVCEETDLLGICSHVLEDLESRAAEKGIHATAGGTHALIRGVPDILYSIVYNLSDNAIKYSLPGGHVYVGVSRIGDPAGKPVVRLTVSDDGIGIPIEDQERIFERFYRVDKSRSRDAGGTGLGLSIVKHGVMIHGADISLKSTPGEGSTFEIDFPCSP